jgi:UDP-N-acetylglucosamine 2-epimerase (non-hydrolysing)
MRSIMLLFGTRPEIVKLAPVVHGLEQHGRCTTLNVCSSQHVDLARRFARQLGVRVDFDLAVATSGQTPTDVLARVVSRLDALLAQCSPDLVVVQGDTTTALAGALAAFHRGIDVAHVEAGLRTPDPRSPFPEEMNRRLITRLACFHLAATARNAAALATEGIPADCIEVTGNPVVDALSYVRRCVPPSESLVRLLAREDGRRLIVLTSHRRENFGEVMRGHFRVLRKFVERRADVVLVFPVHPNPNVRCAAQAELEGAERVRCIAPLDYSDFVHLMSSAWLVVSDSGGVQEEAPSLRKPLIVLRESTERPEAVECGIARLAGRGTERLEQLLDAADADDAWRSAVLDGHNPFGDGRSGERIARALERLVGVTAAADAPLAAWQAARP